MKTSGIGGQAVIEGIMMRNKSKYAIAVRKPDKKIELLVKEGKLLTDKYKWLNIPIIRGIISFTESLITGVSTISYSASFYDDPQEQSDTKVDKLGKAVFKDKLESVLMAVTIIFAVVMAIGLFMVLPYFVSRLLAQKVASEVFLNFVEGLVRMVIFFIYILLISQMKDIKRTFMYHGAEHKCINCIENGARLTPENVKRSSRYHKRCGTSFMFLVIIISAIFFIFIRVDNTVLQLVLRILLVPVIAGVSYEIIKLAGKYDNKFVNAISVPGMLFQKLTTKEPDMDMIEVAIAAVEAVFDVDAFLEEYHKDAEDIEDELNRVEAELALATSFNVNNEKKSRVIKFEKPEKEEDEDAFFGAVVTDEVDTEQEQSEEMSGLSDDIADDVAVDTLEDVNGDILDDVDVDASSDSSIGDYKDYDMNDSYVENVDDGDDGDGFVFEDDEPVEEESDVYAEELPVFKQRRTE